MKLIIDYKLVKREIEGEFAICGQGSDLLNLANNILKKVGKDNNSFYGWVEIREPLPSLESTPNQTPIDWRAGT